LISGARPPGPDFRARSIHRFKPKGLVALDPERLPETHEQGELSA
jgi:hypothetical protein